MDENRDTEKSVYFWLYNGLAILMTFILTFVVINFIWMAYWDATRRNYLMEKLSNCIELDFHLKNSVTVRFPTINYFDPQSLLSWLDARKLVLEIGSRYQIRISFYVSLILLITACMLVFLFAAASGFVDFEVMRIEYWIFFIAHATFLTFACMAILLPTSYLNKQMQY